MAMYDVSDFEESDDFPEVTSPKLGEEIAPSWLRFHLQYESLNETEPLARWLAKVTKKPIDVVLNDKEKWVFSERSKKISDQFYDGINASLYEQDQAEQEQIDLEQAEREKEVDSLMASWVLYPSRYVNRES